MSFVRIAAHDAYAPWESVLGGSPLPMYDDYAPRIARREVWIAERHGEAAGVMVVEPGDGCLTIYSLAVLPVHHSQGIGQWMIQEAEQMARAANVAELRLYTSDRMARNLAIYRRAGFHEVGRRPNPYREGWVLVDMAKTVPGVAGGN